MNAPLHKRIRDRPERMPVHVLSTWGSTRELKELIFYDVCDTSWSWHVTACMDSVFGCAVSLARQGGLPLFSAWLMWNNWLFWMPNFLLLINLSFFFFNYKSIIVTDFFYRSFSHGYYSILESHMSYTWMKRSLGGSSGVQAVQLIP